MYKKIRNFKRIWFVITHLPVIALIIGAFFMLMFLVGSLGGLSSKNNNQENIGIQNMNLSETTLEWLEDVTKECNEQGVPELIPYVMAIIEVETKGTGTYDIMQCAASAGKSRFDSPWESIKQGVSYLKGIRSQGEKLQINDIWAVIQSYNFGGSYIRHLGSSSKVHSLEVAENFSKTVVAPSLGNDSGKTYSYVNAVSQSYGKPYLYRNGGNYFYSILVQQYVGAGTIASGSEMFQAVMEVALQYEGDDYVFGGASPSGFDCSGLIQYCYKEGAGISLPRTAEDQSSATTQISVDDAQPGDLIFFQNTYKDGVSHVGIYVNTTTMYHAGSSGVGYTNWNSAYYQKHFHSIRRIHGVN